MIVAKNFLETINKFIVLKLLKVAFAQRFGSDLISNGFIMKDNIAEKFFIATFAPNFKAFFDGVRVAIDIYSESKSAV